MLSIAEALRRLPDLTISEMAIVVDSNDRRTSRRSSKPKSNETYLLKDPGLIVTFKNHETIVLERIKHI